MARWCIVIAITLGATAAEAQRPETPSRGELVQAFSSLRPALQRCGSVGVVRVRVLFGGGSGRAKQVHVEGNLDRASRTCVERAVRSARVPPFRRRDFAVTYPLLLGR